MLNTLRKSVAGPFVKLLIGILILSFAVWGIQDIFGNYKNSVAIEIDGNEISLDELVNEYNYQLSTISSQLNKQISFDESMALGIDKIAIENLVRKMILQIHDELVFEVSDAEVEENHEEKPAEANAASNDEAQADTVKPEEQAQPEAKTDEA